MNFCTRIQLIAALCIKQILIIGKYISLFQTQSVLDFTFQFHFQFHSIWFHMCQYWKFHTRFGKNLFFHFQDIFHQFFYNTWELWVFCLENFFCFFTNFALEEGLLWTAMWWDFLLIYVRLSDAEKQIWKLNILLQIWAAGLSFIWSRWQKPDLCSHLEVIKRQVILSNRTSLHLQQTVKFLLKNINDCNFLQF